MSMTTAVAKLIPKFSIIHAQYHPPLKWNRERNTATYQTCKPQNQIRKTIVKDHSNIEQRDHKSALENPSRNTIYNSSQPTPIEMCNIQQFICNLCGRLKVVSLTYYKQVTDGGHVSYSHVPIKIKDTFVWAPYEGCEGLTIDPMAARWMKCGSFDFTDDEAEMNEQFDADDEMSD
ncbi:hypothetical protein CSIM01_08874 [Colletotrichum simmondsii]|uniref:Uncharacterized protein n=1 Tax=Colletotrichum simmondsii TaxID=703756 RepID=A0A135TZN9_9PEZI|nr:hypothetical protein CSIM01_08874 [Colletotrichum simmondsii]